MTPRHSVFFGDVAQDKYYEAPHFPSKGDKVIVRELPSQFGGSLANAASIYAQLGSPTSFISQLNSGALTQELLAQLRAQGVCTEHIIFDEAVPDSYCIVLISGDDHVVLIPTLGITHSEISEAAFEHIATAEFFVTTLTDARPIRMGELAAAAVLEALRKRGAQIVMDLDVYNQENHRAGLIQHCDFLFLNAIGAARLVESGEVIDGLVHGGATAVIVTRGNDGCDIHSVAGTISVPAVPTLVVDVTGAGDTFTSAFLHQYSQSGDLKDAAEFANSAASLAVAKVGARGGLATRAEVEKIQNRHYRPPVAS